MLKAVIFDVDGVLINSAPAAWRARRRLLAEYGVDIDALKDPRGEGHRGASLRIFLDTVRQQRGIDIELDEFAQRVIPAVYEELQADITAADPGLILFLEDLKNHDIALAIASSARGEGVANKLKILGISDYFTAVISGTDVPNHKPHPDPYLQAAKALGLPPAECVAIEDTQTGVESALTAGCQAIGFVRYNPTPNPLNGTIHTVQDWENLSYETLRQIAQ